jgi:hypothetical protein
MKSKTSKQGIDMTGNSQGRIFSTWREVAGFLRVSIKTAKRYKQKYDLPIDHYPSGRILAYEDELIRWQKK